MRRREFLSRSLSVAALAGLTHGEMLAESSSGWDQVPGILERIVPPTFPLRDFDIRSYGARGDGVTDCRPAIAAAIAACNHSGGGRVVIPEGVYLVNGPIRILRNVNLYLESGALVRFGTDPSFYLPVVEVRWQGVRCMNYSPLIHARNQPNIAITGAGMFDGQAVAWSSWDQLGASDWKLLQQMAQDGVPVSERVFGPGHHLRPAMFEPYQCENILVEGVTFSASPFWTLHPTFCSSVTVQDVLVLPGITNDDGCDPDSCNDVLIDGCRFNTADDNISIKAGSGPDAIGLQPCTNIVIRNCHALASDWSAYTMGSSTTGNIENVFIENCAATGCIAAFYLKSNTELGGSVQNVWVRQCQVDDCHHLVYLQTDYDYLGDGPLPPLYKNINLADITCADASVSALWFDGDARLPIQDVSLDKIGIGKTPRLDNISNTTGLTAVDVTLGGKRVTVTA
jgi:polygalacturonase